MPAPPSRAGGHLSAHIFARIVGWAAITAGVVLPVGGLLAANPELINLSATSLGLLPVGLYLATRPRPQRDRSAILAATLLPFGAGSLVSGVLSISDSNFGPQPWTLFTGATLLTVGGVHAWLGWAAPEKRPIQRATRLMAVAILVLFSVLSLNHMKPSGSYDYIEPLAMSLDGGWLHIEVPHQGGCANSQMTVDTKFHGGTGVLEVLVYYGPGDGLRCLGGCLSDWRSVCTETVSRRVHGLPDGTTVVAAARPATGLLRLPMPLLLSGIVLGGTLWVAGKKMDEIDSSDRVSA